MFAHVLSQCPQAPVYLGQGSAKRTLERLRQILEAHLSKMPEQDHLPGGLIQPVQRLLEAI